MNILLIHRYFWPDSPAYGSILREIGHSWSIDGHQVSVLTSQPSYRAADRHKEQPSAGVLDGMHIRRFSLLFKSARSGVLRAIKELVFFVKVILYLLITRRYDLIMCSTQPPVLLAFFVGWICKLKRSKHVYHCMDIYPEIALAAGMVQKGWKYRLLQRLDTWTMKNAEHVIVLSQDMANTCCERGVTRTKIRIINNFELPAYEEASSFPVELKRKNIDNLRILFAGNLGKFQGLDVVVETALKLGDGPWEFVFVGEGKAKEELQKQASNLLNKTIFFYPHQSVSVIKKVIEDSDLGIVSLSPEIIRNAYPSKVSTLLAQGCPLLVLMETDSELSTMVRNERCGYAQPLIVDDIVRLLQSPQLILDSKENLKIRALSVAKLRFQKDSVVKDWTDFIGEISAQG
jgi:colanic acid biosynthesis glycosyl transferase WcaI